MDIQSRGYGVYTAVYYNKSARVFAACLCSDNRPPLCLVGMMPVHDAFVVCNLLCVVAETQVQETAFVYTWCTLRCVWDCCINSGVAPLAAAQLLAYALAWGPSRQIISQWRDMCMLFLLISPYREDICRTIFFNVNSDTSKVYLCGMKKPWIFKKVWNLAALL